MTFTKITEVSQEPHQKSQNNDDVIKWKHFSRYWPFVRGIHRSLMNSPHKSQWHGALMFSFIYTRINDWVNNRGAGDMRRHRAHHDVTVMILPYQSDQVASTTPKIVLSNPASDPEPRIGFLYVISFQVEHSHAVKNCALVASHISNGQEIWSSSTISGSLGKQCPLENLE